MVNKMVRSEDKLGMSETQIDVEFEWSTNSAVV